MTKTCLSCNKNPAVLKPPYGWMPCTTCQTRHSQNRVKDPIEMTGEDIKTDRKVYKKDILQPFREGVLSKEYVEAYGAQGINVTPDEVKNAKSVWIENEYYKS